MTFTFNTRDTYIAAQKEWSAEFQKSLNAIRAAKIELKEANRERSLSRIWGAYSTLRKTREAVEKLQLERYRMRQEAHRQWLAERS